MAAMTVIAASCLSIVSAAPGSAYSSGTWKIQPYGCNEGYYSGSSAWNSYGRAEANTNEYGNFCWFGNAQVSVAVYDQYHQVRGGWVYGANNVWSYYSTPLIYGWGGNHSWGSGHSGAAKT